MFKTANVGTADRIVRLILGAILVLLPYTALVPAISAGVASFVAQAVGIVLIVTAIVRFCPLYRLLGTNTCKAP
jgi:hypothetical protein